jgi:SAM-dependent methyltransferase
MTVRYLVADVFDGLATIDDGSVDLVVTSPPFLALRSYLPSDHPDKGKEIGSEATPAEFLDVLLRVTQELRRVLAPHGSIAIELGDTYAGSGGAGGDYQENGWREYQEAYGGSGRLARYADDRGNPDGMRDPTFSGANTLTGAGQGWPLAKSRTLIPELYRVALAYGFNPLTGQPSPTGQWRVRNVVTWCRPNPPVGALGDKWRPATSDVVVACLSGKRYWDDLATRKASSPNTHARSATPRHDLPSQQRDGNWSTLAQVDSDPTAGAPLLDYWEIPPGGFKGSHYAVFPAELVVPLVKAMTPERVCRTCGEPSRRIVETEYQSLEDPAKNNAEPRVLANLGEGRQIGNYDPNPAGMIHGRASRIDRTTGWTDCGHDDWRPGLVLDPFAGSGTTLMVAHGHGHDSIGIDLDERNLELARERVGPFFFDEVTV